VNVCGIKPYLLYGADVINWNNSDLASIRHAFNSAMCKVYKVKFQLLDSIYDFTNQRDIVQDIIFSTLSASLHRPYFQICSKISKSIYAY